MKLTETRYPSTPPDFDILRAQRSADKLDVNRHIFLNDFRYLHLRRRRRRSLLFGARHGSASAQQMSSADIAVIARHSAKLSTYHGSLI